VPGFLPAGLPRRSRRHSSRTTDSAKSLPPAVGFPRVLGNPRTASPAQIHRVRAGWSLEGVQPPIHFRYTAPPCLPDPRDPMVLPRPGFVGAAPALPRNSRLGLPPASPGRCDSPAARSHTPPDPTAPRGARPRPPSAHAALPARRRRSAQAARPSQHSRADQALPARSPATRAPRPPSPRCPPSPAQAIRSSGRFLSSRWTCSHSPRSQQERTRREDRHLQRSTSYGTTSTHRRTFVIGGEYDNVTGEAHAGQRPLKPQPPNGEVGPGALARPLRCRGF